MGTRCKRAPAGARIYDSRIARFLSIDPDATKYPFMTPYCFAGNNPIILIDINGQGPGLPNEKINRKFEKWKKRNRDENIGSNEFELYEKFRNSKNWLGKYRFETKLIKNYENQTLISKATNETVTIQNAPHTIKITGGQEDGSGSGSMTTVVDLEGASGNMHIWYEMFGCPDRLQVINEETGDIIFDTKNINFTQKESVEIFRKDHPDMPIDDGADFDGEYDVKFKLSKGTKVRISINQGKTLNESTSFMYQINVTVTDTKNPGKQNVTKVGKKK